MLPVGSTVLMWSVRFLTWPFFISSKTSSTYRFQNYSLHWTGAVAIACFSSHSINKLASSRETGLLIVEPNICWYMTPLKEKYVVVTINFNKSIMSSTVRCVLVWSSVSPSNRSRITCRARSTGVLVKSDTTWWLLASSSQACCPRPWLFLRTWFWCYAFSPC